MWFLQRARWILPRLRMTVWKIMKDRDEAHHPFRFSFDCWCVNPRPMMSSLISRISSPKSSVYFCYGVQNSTVRHVQTNRVCHQEGLENKFTSSFWCPLWERTSTDAIFLWTCFCQVAGANHIPQRRSGQKCEAILFVFDGFWKQNLRTTILRQSHPETHPDCPWHCCYTRLNWGQKNIIDETFRGGVGKMLQMKIWRLRWRRVQGCFKDHLSLHPSIHASIHLSIHKFIHKSIHKSIHKFIHKSINISKFINPMHLHNIHSIHSIHSIHTYIHTYTHTHLV